MSVESDIDFHGKFVTAHWYEGGVEGTVDSSCGSSDWNSYVCSATCSHLGGTWDVWSKEE